MENEKKILLVEDEKNIILGVRTCLEAVGYEVEVVEDGEAAINIMKESSPDLLLLDLMLPKVDGFEVCRTLKENEDERIRKTPIVVLSAKAGEEDRQRAMELGADAYMTKPFRPRELWDEIKKFLPDQE